MPTLEKLRAQDPEVQPFLYPVDPIALCIPVSHATHAGTSVEGWKLVSWSTFKTNAI
jgi:hypothetical protein